MKNIIQFFGPKYANKNTRILSYNFVEQFIKQSHNDWSTPPLTNKIVENFLRELKKLKNNEFSFLILHSGYIPETYKPDSSQETLYSKLIEAIVLEWANRIGFKESILPTQKASMEDISILDKLNVIVCDAKSFRLGRSQAAPNVKDVLKHSDIKKWLNQHKNKKQLGGLVTLPSQHDWKKGSDFYQYTTDKSSPTISLYYEHLAFFLLTEIKSNHLINILESYPKLFPNKILKSENNREYYYKKVEKALFSNHPELWPKYKKSAHKIITECVYHSLHLLDKHITVTKENIKEKYLAETNIKVLQNIAIEAEFLHKTENLQKQKDRIKKFRDSAKDYHEK